MFKLLYVSSFHSTLEKLDLDVFSELGIDWFSSGVYLDPQNPHESNMKGPIDRPYPQDLKDEWLLHNENIPRGEITITKEFADRFDVIFINNFTRYLAKNWENIKHKTVIFRTYDGHSGSTESLLKYYQTQRLKVVRLFDFEARLPYAAKADAVISNYVDVKEYKDWDGSEEFLLTFQNDFIPRMNAKDRLGNLIYPGYKLYLDLIKKHKYKLHGQSNPQELSGGFLTPEGQLEAYRCNRAYFSLGSKPGPYTYNWLEALAAGIPTISFGMGLGDYHLKEYRNSYIVPSLIENGVNGFCSDSVNDLDFYISELMLNPNLAKNISKNGRKLVAEKFSKEKNIEEWREFFKCM